MAAYVALHLRLKEMRDRGRGSRVLVAGPMDSGKSSLASTLASWAARDGHQPLVVDLDVGQGDIGVPGTIGVLRLGAAGRCRSSSCWLATTPVSWCQLMYFYGHTNMAADPALYMRLVERLAKGVDRRVGADKQARAAGVIVNTAGWVKGLGLRILLHSIKSLAIDVVLVLGDDSLRVDMQRQLEGVQMMSVPRPSGIVRRDATIRSRLRIQRVRQYFDEASEVEVAFKEVTIVRSLRPAVMEI